MQLSLSLLTPSKTFILLLWSGIFPTTDNPTSNYISIFTSYRRTMPPKNDAAATAC